MLRSFPICLALTCAALVGCGCNSNPAPKPNANSGHEHSHDHAGPHMGKVMVIGTEEFHAEILWDNSSGKVTVYLLDKDVKANAAAASAQETITIEGKLKDETRTYELAAVNRMGDPPMASQFEVDDKDLASLLENLGGNNTATLKVKIGEKEFPPQNISFDDHGHDH